MAESLLTIDLFRETIYKLHDILTPYGLDLVNIITSVSERTFIFLISNTNLLFFLCISLMKRHLITL